MKEKPKKKIMGINIAVAAIVGVVANAYSEYERQCYNYIANYPVKGLM